jgi:hypothetical protein
LRLLQNAGLIGLILDLCHDILLIDALPSKHGCPLIKGRGAIFTCEDLKTLDFAISMVVKDRANTVKTLHKLLQELKIFKELVFIVDHCMRELLDHLQLVDSHRVRFFLLRAYLRVCCINFPKN